MNNFMLMNLTTDKMDNFLEKCNLTILIQKETEPTQYDNH